MKRLLAIEKTVISQIIEEIKLYLTNNVLGYEDGKTLLTITHHGEVINVDIMDAFHKEINIFGYNTKHDSRVVISDYKLSRDEWIKIAELISEQQ